MKMKHIIKKMVFFDTTEDKMWLQFAGQPL